LIQKKAWMDIKLQLQTLKADIVSATTFVQEIERGNLDVSIGDEIANPELKTSLVNMRDQMKRYSLTEKERNWANEGLAKFVQILRSGNTDEKQHLADHIIRNLVVYLQANQGALFALNDNDPNDPFLEMEACYAYDRKKFLEKRIALGEGLAGQVALEKSTVYITDVPPHFIKITSGLGEALPRNILLVPLKLDEKIYGVVEIASFQVLQPYQIDFVERLGESIASTLAAIKGNERTRALLQETRQQTEELKAQEEELRQNMEELSTTQEAMQRSMKEAAAKEAYISQLLNASEDYIYTIDSEFKFVTWNKAFENVMRRAGNYIGKGVLAFEWAPDERSVLVEWYKRAFSGETFEAVSQNAIHGKIHHYVSIFSPLKSESGEIVEVAIFSKDITALTEAQQETTRLLQESQQRAEELKAQEEELRQNMEELSATQEGMQRALKEVELKEAYISQILDTSKDAIYTVDREFRMMTWNASFSRYAELHYVRLEKGMNAFEWSPEDRQKLIELYKRVFEGETFGITYDIELSGINYHFLSDYAPIKSATGDIETIAIFAKDITPIVKAQQESARLLQETQQQAEELKAQEEELRQNMEELSATQDGMQRAMQEVEAKEAYVSQLLNVSQDIIFTVDRDFKLVTWNERFAQTVVGLGVRPQKGIIAFGWRPDAERQYFVELFKRAFNGETFEARAESKYDGNTHHFISTFAPLRAKTHEISEVAVFARDVTALVNAQKMSAERSEPDLPSDVNPKSTSRKNDSERRNTPRSIVPASDRSPNGKSPHEDSSQEKD